MFKNILSKRVKNLLNTMVMPAILYAENLIGKGFGEAKKQAAIDFILGKLPVFLIPFKGIIKKLLFDILDFAIEEGVKKLHSIQKNLPQAL